MRPNLKVREVRVGDGGGGGERAGDGRGGDGETREGNHDSQTVLEN